MTETYNLTVSNLIQVRAAGVSYQLTLVPARSAGGSTKPLRFLTDEELRRALFSLGMTGPAIEDLFRGLQTDGFYWLPGLSLSDEQQEKFGLVASTHGTP
jgi:hypothetical protein